MSHPKEVKSQTIEVVDTPDDNEPHSSTEERTLIRIIQHSWTKNGQLKFIITALCIFLAYCIVGILQEKIMRGCYGDTENKDCRNGEKFKYAVTLVAVQSLCAFTFIKSIAKFLIAIIFLCLIMFLNRESTNFFLKFSLFSFGPNKARRKGCNTFRLLYRWIDGKCSGHDLLQYGIAFRQLPNAGDLQIGETDRRHDFWHIHLQALHNSAVHFRDTDCDWCGCI